MPAAAQNLDLGKLLRLHAMVTASQVDATRTSARALSLAYINLTAEIRQALSIQGLEDLLAEFDRVFTPLAEVPEAVDVNDLVATSRANEALVKLRQVGGWVQGLLDELTFEQRMRMEAEEKARLAAKPTTGFGTP